MSHNQSDRSLIVTFAFDIFTNDIIMTFEAMPAHTLLQSRIHVEEYQANIET